MSAAGKRKIAKIESTYVYQQEAAGLAAARKRKLLLRRLSLFFTFAIFASYFMISSILSQASVINEKKAQKKQLEKELSDLKQQQTILKENIAKLNDDDYIAKLARKNFFMSNQNEIIFHIPEKNKEKSSTK
ncbi:FtsB family cell division protein [Neobacillus sp. SM06]|uniref:FtsB family cell division protein n=1 Tax=Neobacillus sp. SM06 TaxID=3422492 RepID=UPI003D2BFE88